MKSYREELWFQTDTRRAYVNITPQVEAAVRKSGVREGMVLVNAMHITASVYINDDEPGLLKDYDRFLERLAPHEADYQHNLTGEDNGDAHIKRQPARIIHDGFYCNRRYAATTSLAAMVTRPGGRARHSVGQQPGQGCLPSVARSALLPASRAPTKGASPLVRSPRRRHTPFATPMSWL
jgi:thiamine phosphate synthase YjbQ (UPF0047 family)